MMDISNLVLNLAIGLLGLLLLVGTVAVGIWSYTRWKKYQQFRCVIWEKDGFGQVTETYDKAGIFVDGKTKNKRFFMKRANVGLEPDNVPYIPAGKYKVVYLARTGLKNFMFIKPVLDREKVELNVSEEDVNWAVNAYDRAKKMFLSTLLGQILPYLLLAFVSIIILVLFVYLFKKFGVLVDVATALQAASEHLEKAALYNSGNFSNITVVIPT